jgi:hypothetical protein
VVFGVKSTERNQTLKLEFQSDGRGVFIRTLLEQLEDGFDKPLRTVTEKAQEEVITLGGSCSISYIRSLRMELARAGFVRTRKSGKTWTIAMTLLGQDEWHRTKDMPWGYEVSPPARPDLLDESLFTELVPVHPNDEKAKRVTVFDMWRNGKLKMYVTPISTRVSRLKSDHHRYIVQLSDDEESE